MSTSLTIRFGKGWIETRDWMLKLPLEVERQTMNEMAFVADEYIKDGIAEHTKTGVLASSYFNRQTPGKRGREIGHNLDIAPYAQWVIGGAKPHPIVAKNGPFLHFYWERMGRWVKTPKVNHPGYKGDDYISRAQNNALARFQQIIDYMSIG